MKESFDSLTQPQQDALQEELEELGLAGNPLLINQQIVSGTSLLATQAQAEGDAALAQSAHDGLSEVQQVILSRYQGQVVSDAIWAKGSTITVSAAGFTADQMQTLSEVLAQYADLTGLRFHRVASGGQIELGFANLNTPHTGAVGLTTTTQFADGSIQSARIVLENPDKDPLDVDGMYEQTQASFAQVLTHELGHALGMGDNNSPGSVWNYYLGSDNRTMSAQDKWAFSTLYGAEAANDANVNAHYSTGTNASLMTQTQLNQLLQAMASTQATPAAVSTSTGVFISAPGSSRPLTLVSSAVY